MSETKPQPDEIVAVRNEINGQATEMPYWRAQGQIDHPVYGEHFSIVRTAKPEVLADRSDKSTQKDEKK